MENLYSEQKKIVKSLIDTAEELFAIHGYEGTSLRMIGDQLHMNPSVIYYYFGSKEDLYNEIFYLRIKEINNKLRTINTTAMNEIEKLHSFIAGYMETIRQNMNFLRILFREIYLQTQNRWAKRLVVRSMQVYSGALRKIIEAGIENRLFKKINPEMFILNFFMLFPSLTLIGKMNNKELKDYLQTIIIIDQH